MYDFYSLLISAIHGPLAESHYISLFGCSFVRPAMVTSPLLLAPDPQTHTFSDNSYSKMNSEHKYKDKDEYKDNDKDA